MRREGWLAVAVAVAAACGSSEEATPAASGGAPAPAGPITAGAWTFYGAAEGLSPDVHDVSADEDGNVYVAGGDALYVKRAADARFLRFDAENGGLTADCNDLSEIMQPAPSRPFHLCPVISVAGASGGKAIVGFQGLGFEADLGSTWVFLTGGADVVAFDAATGELRRTRHVDVASPPHVVCGATGEDIADTCEEDDYWWNFGRRVFRQVFRIVVNHDRSSPLYGDAWMGGNHGTFAVLLANAAARGWTDRTAGFEPVLWEHARDVWEHLHPSIITDLDHLLLGEGWALSIDPRDGRPWGSNGIRTAYVEGYGADLTGRNRWWMGPPGEAPFLDLWPDSGDVWDGPSNDRVRSMSHCPDGTLWIGSLTHGLARIDPGGAISRLPVPDPAAHGTGVSAVACDPSDASVWIGLASGGVLRLHPDGSLAEAAPSPPAVPFARQPVRSIQIDRWTAPRVVYFAHGATKDESGLVVSGGGISAYDGP